MARDDEFFLERWSRRKHAARRGEPLPPEPPPKSEQSAAVEPEPPPPPPVFAPTFGDIDGPPPPLGVPNTPADATATDAAVADTTAADTTAADTTAADTTAPAPELPSLESLKGLASDYKPFMQPEVDAATRGAALKNLFSDPHFNQMDGLDVYIDDYSKVEPLPSPMLRVLNQVKHLGLFDDENKETAEAAMGTGSEATQPAEPVEPTEAQVPALPEEPITEASAAGVPQEESSAALPSEEEANKPGSA